MSPGSPVPSRWWPGQSGSVYRCPMRRPPRRMWCTSAGLCQRPSSAQAMQPYSTMADIHRASSAVGVHLPGFAFTPFGAARTSSLAAACTPRPVPGVGMLRLRSIFGRLKPDRLSMSTRRTSRDVLRQHCHQSWFRSDSKTHQAPIRLPFLRRR